MEQKLREIIREEIRSMLNEQDGEYEYPDAGENAPEEVQQAIERFREMDPDERETNVLLYWLLGDGTPSYKMSKADSQYSDDTGTDEQACVNCEYLYQKTTSGEYICSQIRGKVDPGGWCNQWELAESIQDNE